MTMLGFARTGDPVVVSPKDESRVITNVAEWLEWAGPLRGERQWADGRSAKEVAKAWCRVDGTIEVPPELQALLDSNPALGRFKVATVIPELPTPLGDVPRGARRHDLVLLGTDGAGRHTLVGVEAKADEPFDASIEARVATARARARTAAEHGRAHTSHQLPRIDRLSRALIGRPALEAGGKLDPEIAKLPYQLLAGVAGTLIEAASRGAGQAAFVVHAFHSVKLDTERIAANDRGFARFVAALPGAAKLDVAYGRLLGPLGVPAGDGIPMLPLYIGIAATKLR